MEEYKKEMLMVSAILFKNNVPVEEAKHIGAFIEKLIEENQQLKEQLEKEKEVIDKVMNLIKKYGKYDGEKCIQGFQMWSADFNKILDILKEVE